MGVNYYYHSLSMIYGSKLKFHDDTQLKTQNTCIIYMNRTKNNCSKYILTIYAMS